MRQGLPFLTTSSAGDVTASETATYAFCAKAWHLERVLRQPVARQALHRRAIGTALHQEHGTDIKEAPRTVTRLLVWAMVLLGLAAVLVSLALFANR